MALAAPKVQLVNSFRRWKCLRSVTEGTSVASTPGPVGDPVKQHSERVPEQAAGRPLQGRFTGSTTVRGYCAPPVTERRPRCGLGGMSANHQLSIFNFSFADFCHDSAKQASLMALAAPKVQLSTFNFQLYSCCVALSVESSKSDRGRMREGVLACFPFAGLGVMAEGCAAPR